MYVCTPHDVARSVLIACGESGKPCKNPELRDLIARSSKQSASFNRSVVANKALQEEQLKANPKMKAHQTLNTATKNTTRWLGLWEMCNRNRRVGPEIRIALTGEADGICAEVAAPPARLVEARESQHGREVDDRAFVRGVARHLGYHVAVQHKGAAEAPERLTAARERPHVRS